MNTKPVRVYAAALTVSAAALALFVTGCSDDSSGSSAASSATSTAAGSSAAPSVPASGGASTASVDGKALDGKFETTCAKQGGQLALALSDTNNATYGTLSVSAAISGTDTVDAVAVAGSKGGSNGLPYAIGFGNGMPGGSAKVVKDGNTYKVTGEGVSGDMSNPMAGPTTAKFDITFTCSTVVGG
ncbi:lipoprotein LpqH [Nocardia australiensis]|uniref:lipoprotein LpqH n=1 Tax=Nocardia australiensis TaxID=2887191 RepID=UPI001D14336A|nr:lipoprotein LpqH [Nocardia australiensis]